MSEFLPDPTIERAAVINHDALAHNFKVISEWVAPAQVMSVLKADAYGHGAIEVAKTLVHAGAKWLGTAHVREALALREAGITVPLLAWLHTERTPFIRALEENIDVGISGPELDAVVEAAKEVGKPARVHLKVDTGLGRNGASMLEWEDFCRAVAQHQAAGHVRAVAVFTHFGVADDPERAADVDEQLAVYNRAVDIARKMGLTIDVRHVANSPALLSRPDTHLDMVRAGLATYGLSPFGDRTPAELNLKPAMSLRTLLTNNKPADAGQGVSYGYLYRTPAPTRLGLVPLGYADGIPRSAVAAPVWIDGTRYETVGRVAMDQIVVDLHVDQDDTTVAPVGSPVEIFGSASGIHASELADACGTINYEIVTRIGARVPRVHINQPDFTEETP